jgi:hypothetical protein
MSSDLVRELFRSVENTLYERLRIIEDILVKSSPVPVVAPPVEAVSQDNTETRQTLEVVEKAVETINARLLRLEETVSRLLTAVREQAMGSDDRGVEEVEAEIEVEAAELEALNADANASVHESETQATFRRVVAELRETVVSEQAADEDADNEAEEEEAEVEEEEAEVEEEEAEVEEEEALAVEEFTYRKRTYYRDADNNVYGVDEEGDIVSDPIGKWNPDTQKIVPI